MSRLDLYFLLVCLFFAGELFSQQLVINEMMSSNSNFLQDEDGDYSDWIEIYNASPQSVPLLGYYLSDRSFNLTMWAFPDTVIPAQAHLLVFASGKNRNIAGAELHTSFSIAAGGEALFLSNENEIVDEFPEVELVVNQSYGYLVDGQFPLVKYIGATPGYSNSIGLEYVSLEILTQGGFSNSLQELTIECSQSDVEIRFTIDGSSPSFNSLSYSEPQWLSEDFLSTANVNQVQISPSNYYYPDSADLVPKIIVIRAAAYNQLGELVSDIVTKSFIINDISINHQLPVVSICGDYYDLFHEEYGILVPGVNYEESNEDWSGNYYQRGNDWERKINLEFYESVTNEGFNQCAGLRVHGASSRRFTQKAFRFYSRAEYGAARFEYPLFDEKNITSYKRLIMRPFMSSWNASGLEDLTATTLALQLGLDAPGTRPVVLYLNGEYWGIYLIQERIDDKYLEDNFGINPDAVDLINSWFGNVADGDNEDFLDLYQFVNSSGLADSLNYQTVLNRIDIDNFIDYQIFQIFVANVDWPANNMKCWREKIPSAKWRWIFVDGDAAYNNCNANSYSNAFDTSDDFWPTNATSTLFIRKLLENHKFSKKFFDRLGQVLELMSPSITTAVYDSALALTSGEINHQIERFTYPINAGHFEMGVIDGRGFLECRPCKMVEKTLLELGRVVHVDFCENDIIRDKNLLTRIYPNPNDGRFTVYFWSEEDQNVSVTSRDIHGRELFRDIKFLHTGDNYFYFGDKNISIGMSILTITTETSSTNVKLVVK
jgi:hypothetical protein